MPGTCTSAVLLLAAAAAVAAPARAARVCLQVGEPVPAALEALAALPERIAADTPLGRYFDALLRDSGVSLCLDAESGECRGYFTPDANAIALRPGLDPDEAAVILAHELRHLDQFRRGFAPSTDYAMQEMARQAFALEADAQAVGALFAWEQRDPDPGLWAGYLGFPRYRDIALSFAAARETGADEAAATLAAFRAWYGSAWRRETYYVSSCSAYVDLLDSANLLPSYARLPADHFDDLCVLPGGRNYGCAATDEIRLVGVPPR